MSHTEKTEDFHSKIPGSFPDDRPETLDMKSLDTKCEIRFFETILNVSLHQEMPRGAINVRQSIAQVKKSLGHRARTHYKTMLNNPSNKLAPFTFPGMTIDQLKSLAKVLSTSDLKQRTQLKKDAGDKRRAFVLEQELKRKEELAAKREEAVTRRSQIAQENNFLMGLAEEVKYKFTDEHDFQKMLDRYLTKLQAGERFLISVGETWFTLSLRPHFFGSISYTPKKTAGFFAFEIQKKQLAFRICVL